MDVKIHFYILQYFSNTKEKSDYRNLTFVSSFSVKNVILKTSI